MPRRTKPDPTTTRDALILNIAQRQFNIETLETRNQDRFDFHDIAVWAIREALAEAFEAGRRTGRAETAADLRVGS